MGAMSSYLLKPDPQDASQRLYMTGDMGLMRPDGCVVHLGRKDDQVQIRGYRVELAEIEMALRGIEEVEDAAVAALDDGGAVRTWSGTSWRTVRARP